MIEKIILDHLTGELEVPVYMEVPDNPPDSFVIIEKTGSSRENLINAAIIAVQSFALTMYQAAELNDKVKTAMDGLILLPEVTASRLNSDYNYTDTSSKRYRYQCVYDVTHY